MSAPIDDGDVIDIQGQCADLNRKNNRILVEVYAGVDETVTPYINNDIGVDCQPTSNAVTAGIEASDYLITPSNVYTGPSTATPFQIANGTPPYVFALVQGVVAAPVFTGSTFSITSPATSGTTVFKITDAAGKVFNVAMYTDAGVVGTSPNIATNQCFWVTKGIGVTEMASPSNKVYPQCHDGRFGFSIKVGRAQSYTARLKLRTLDGIISDSVWSEVRVDRALNTPIIRTISYDQTTVSLNIKSEMARFNFGIVHTLARTYTDIIATGVAMTDLFANAVPGSIVPGTGAGASLFEQIDDKAIEGVTYNYTLKNSDISTATAALTPVSSPVLSFEVPRATFAVSGGPTVGRCYFAVTPPIGHGFYEWGRSLTKGWTGPGSNTNIPGTNGYATATCGVTTACTEAGLTSGQTYWFAVRAFNFGQIGKWSVEQGCTVP